MSALSNFLSGAVGYAIADASGSNAIKTAIDRNFGNKSLEQTIRDYARTRCGVYHLSNEFAKQLHDIAKTFEEYNYDRVYGDEPW